MSMLEIMRGYTPTENPEFGAKKKLIGDAVAQCSELASITSKKNGSKWLVLKCEAIHAIKDPKGRETTVEAGDKLEKLYNPADGDSIMELANDLFTAGVEFDKDVDSEDILIENMSNAVKGKLIYFRTWAKNKTDEQLKNKPEPTYFQNIAIKSKNLITPENSTPTLPF